MEPLTTQLLRRARDAGKQLLRRAGFIVHRWPGTRFEAMEDALQLLRLAGFQPDVVLDIGANHGQWARKAYSIFPEATFHLVEPQTGCADSLRNLAASTANIHYHPFVMTGPGVSSVVMSGGGELQDSGGNFILGPGDSVPNPVTYPATSVDVHFASVGGTRILFKLDVEGHELTVLKGAPATLQRVEVIVAEFWAYRIWGKDMTTLAELVKWMNDAGFDLYDFAALVARRRDNRLRGGDVIFVRRGSPLLKDVSWN
jgi:FkbM family methyltransferase